jgi:gliding motility-associated-like protein
MLPIVNMRMNSIKFIAVIFLTLTALSLHAVNAPVPRCAEVQETGEVVLSWQPPSDPGGLFFSYVIYVEDLATGDPVQIGEILDFNNTTFVDDDAFAQDFVRTYYLQTKSGNTGQLESNLSPPIQTMLLETTAGNQNALAYLSWNAPFVDFINSSSGLYNIYRENLDNEWIQVGTTVFGNELFIDTVQGICHDPPANINYRVEMTDNSGCLNVSSIDGADLTDGTGPTPPIIETVSIDTLTGNVLLCWYPSPESDTQGYFIQDNTDPTQYITVGNNTEPDSVCFLHTVTPGGPKKYLVIAYDECGNDQSFGIGHETMHLTAQLQECDQQVDLSWTAYIGWQQGVLLYEVQASQDGGEFEIIQTNSPGNRTLTVDVNPFTDYCFRVRAMSQGPQRSSFSNTVCLETTYPQTPEFSYLNGVTVTPDNLILVTYLDDEEAFMMDYRLERKAPVDMDFEEIGIMQPNLFTGLYEFLDEEVNPQNNQYQYRVAAYDFCNNFHSYSNVSRNMLLNAFEDNEDYLSKLDWTSYQIWDGGVSEYTIYRSLGRQGPFEPLITTSGNVSYYEDDVFELIDSHGEFCYYIEARENFNSFGRADSVRSNVACAEQDPLFWIPNAFMVGGYNDIFKPVAGYVDFERYEMQIFSRWGKLMFRSAEINVGWNGYHNGSVAPEGAYIYVISYTTGAGKRVEETGYVILLNGFN